MSYVSDINVGKKGTDMTIEEAIDYITHHAFIADDVKDMAIEALEKQIPKKMENYYCPICRHYFEDGEEHIYCPSCGQAID